MTPTATRKPAHEAFRRHIDVCRYAGDLRRCPDCRGLDADASAESYRRTTNSEDRQRG